MSRLSTFLRHPKKTFKKVVKEVFRPGKQVWDENERFLEHVAEEGIRPLGQVVDALGNILQPPIPGGGGGDTGDLPIPDAPIGYGMEGEGAYSKKRKAVKSGRGGTILAGPLSPGNIGKKVLG